MALCLRTAPIKALVQMTQNLTTFSLRGKAYNWKYSKDGQFKDSPLTKVTKDDQLEDITFLLSDST